LKVPNFSAGPAANASHYAEADGLRPGVEELTVNSLKF
jgi:hypothetical protein